MNIFVPFEHRRVSSRARDEQRGFHIKDITVKGAPRSNLEVPVCSSIFVIFYGPLLMFFIASGKATIVIVTHSAPHLGPMFIKQRLALCCLENSVSDALE